MARMRKYGESKTTRIMMATVPHVTSGLGLRKFQADGFLLTRVYNLFGKWPGQFGDRSPMSPSSVNDVIVNPTTVFDVILHFDTLFQVLCVFTIVLHWEGKL